MDIKNKLLFGQQHITTYSLFKPEWTNVPIEEFPHYKYFKNGDIDILKKYISQSWKNKNVKFNYSEKRFKEYVKKLDELYSTIESDGKIKEPILITERYDGNFMLIDGNHRTSIAKILDLELPYETRPLNEHLRRLCINPKTFYGSMHNEIPYQSIFYNGELLVEGRRTEDIIERMNKIYKSDIKNKSVIDLGCNIGAMCHLTYEAGASNIVGVDVEDSILNSAVRLSVALNRKLYYYNVDLSIPQSIIKDKFHTGYCFSIDEHVNNNKALAKNIDSLVYNVLYFETHTQRHKIPKEISKLFKHNDYLGVINVNGTKRNLFRLSKF